MPSLPHQPRRAFPIQTAQPPSRIDRLPRPKRRLAATGSFRYVRGKRRSNGRGEHRWPTTRSSKCAKSGMSDTHSAIEAVWKIESTRLIAGIARVTHDIGIAEELAQD